jgi:hypothetical protein
MPSPHPVSPKHEVFDLVRNGQVTALRTRLGVPTDVASDQILVDGIIALEQGIALFVASRPSEALPHLRKALPIVQSSTDSELKLLMTLLGNLCDGLARLQAGDAHGALPFLDRGSEVLERMSFYVPGLKKLAISARATCFVTLAKAHLNHGDIAAAELWLGRTRDQYRQLLTLLNPADPADSSSFSEVYGSSVETAVLFATLDLYALDFDAMRRRLTAAESDASQLASIIEKTRPDPVQDIQKTLLVLFHTLWHFHDLARRVISDRLPIRAAEVEKSRLIQQGLFEATNLASQAGAQGAGLGGSLQTLRRLHGNLLAAGRASIEDFGRFNGIVTACCLILLVVVVQVAAHPSGIAFIPVFLGEIIVALVAGYGYNAVRFHRLLKLYAGILPDKAGGKE